MNMKIKYKRDGKFFYIVILLAILSVLNTLEGFFYCKEGVSSTFFVFEGLSILISLLILHGIWCIFDEGKCTTIKKH